MAEPQQKRRRIAPTLVAPSDTSRSALQVASADDLLNQRPGPVEYSTGPSTLPGRRMKADLSNGSVIEFKQLLKQHGVDPKELKSCKDAEASTPTQCKPPSGLPPLPGMGQAGKSPSAKDMYSNVVDRLERFYGAIAEGEESDEDEEAETDEGEAEDSDDDGSDEPDSDSDGDAGTAAEQSEPGGTQAAAAPGGGGGASDSGAGGAVAKKPRRKRIQFEAYEDDFIDDADEIQYDKTRKIKSKYQGFFVNQGRVEVEPTSEDEESQRPMARRAPRPRQPAAQPGNTKQAQPTSQQQQQHEQAQVQGQGQMGAAVPQQVPAQQQQPAAGGSAGTQRAANGGNSTPVRKRKVEGEGPQQQQQPQPAVKKRKQATQVEPGVVPPAHGSAAPPGAESGPSDATRPPARSAPQGLAALAAALGKSKSAASGATAAGMAAAAKAAEQPPPAVQPAAPATSAAALVAVMPAQEAVLRGEGPSADTSGPTGTTTAGTTIAAADAAAVAGTSTAPPPVPRATTRRAFAAPSSLEPLIAECVKKLSAAANPPPDWAALAKVIDNPLTQVALYMHRSCRDAPAQQAAREQLAAALVGAVPGLAGGATQQQQLLHEQLAAALQKKVDKNLSTLASLVNALQKLSKEAVEADAAATSARAAAAAAGAGAHSSDDEFAEPAAAAAAAAGTAHLEALEAKLRSYLNLYHKLHMGEDDEAVLVSLAKRLDVDASWLRRAAAINQVRAPAQRKRQAGKAASASQSVPNLDNAQLRQQATNIAYEIFGSVAVAAGSGGTGAEPAPAAAGTGANKYVLRAVKPGAEAKERAAGRGGGGGAGGSAASSPAHALPPAGWNAGTRDTGPETKPPPPPFHMPRDGIPCPASLATATAAALLLRQAADARDALALAVDDTGDARTGAGVEADATVDGASGTAGAGASAGPARGEDESVLAPQEEERQNRESIEAAVQAGADRQQVENALKGLRSRNARVVVKTLCHAGPGGLRVVDIVRNAIERRYTNWPPNSDRSSSVHQAIRIAGLPVAYVGNHHYALTLFPGVVAVPKPGDARKAGPKAGAAGGSAAMPAAAAGSAGAV